MPPGSTFREQVIAKFYGAFGQPEVTAVRAGEIYRWTLSRGPYGIAMFITVDSPEYTDIAHVMISDAAVFQVEPVVAVSLRTLGEADAVIDRILKQWRTQPSG